MLYCVKRSLHKHSWSFTLRHVRCTHTNSGFFKLVKPLLQIRSYFFSHSIKLRVFPLSSATVLLHYLPRCLCCWCPGHMRQNIYHRNLKWTFDEFWPCYCYAIKNNSRTIRSQVSQPPCADKGADISEPQAAWHQKVNLALVQCECHIGK